MKTKVVAQDADHQPYLTDLLSSLLSMQKTSSYTDCTLISSDGTAVPAHLPMLSLSWPRLEQLLPPSDGLCSCQCCVQGIALPGEAETVQAVLELAYTGKSGVLGVLGERKVKQLLQVLGIEWDLKRVENESECNNNNSRKNVSENLIISNKHKSESPNKESLEDGTLITPVDAEVNVKKSLCNISIDDDVLLVNGRRKSIPREVKVKKPVSNSKSPGLIEKKKGSKGQPRQPNEKTTVKLSCTAKPLELPVNNENNEHEKGIGPFRDLDSDYSSEVVKSLPELNKIASVEKEDPLNSAQVTEESVAAVQKTRIAPGTLMTNVDNCVRFFCSYCEVEMTKLSKAEKEAHWSVVHFFEELSKLTHHGIACNVHDCNMKVETREEMVKHVGVFHKKIYNFLSCLPPVVADKPKQSPGQNPSELFNPSKNFYSRAVYVKPGNPLKAPVIFVKCTLLNSETGKRCAPSHLTKASVEEWTVLSESVSSKFLVTNQRWYYTCLSSNNNPSFPVLTSLTSHYSSLLGEEDPAKCSFCPHLKEQHSRLSLHQSVAELARGEGSYWCGLCCQQVVSEEQFQHHLASHLLTCMDKPGPGLGSGQGSHGRKDVHVFFSAVSSTRDPELRTPYDSPCTNNAGANLKEEISSDSSGGLRCNICEKVLSSAHSLKRHMHLVHSKGNLKKVPAVKLYDSGNVVTGPVQNKDFDFCVSVINTKVNNDLLETCGEGFAMNDKKSYPPEEEKDCEVVRSKSRGNDSGKRKHACIICNMTFSSVSRVKSHLALCHFKEKMMQEIISDLDCSLCDRAFHRNSELVTHVGIYHGRSEAYLKVWRKEHLSETVNQIDRKEEELSESDVLNASFKDEINFDSSTGFVESEDILSFFAQP